jgi:hypothetical protein
MSGGNNQVGPGNLAVLVHLVVVIQRTARGLDLPRTFQPVDAGRGAHLLVEDEWIIKDTLDILEPVESLNQPRMMIVEGALDRSGRQLLELGQFLVGQRRAH